MSAGDRFDVLSSRTSKDGKTYYTKIGVMWPLKNGGYRITFEALPVGRVYEGEYRVEAVCFPPKERSGAPGGGGAAASDDIPY
jgi:hypothetical protein